MDSSSDSAKKSKKQSWKKKLPPRFLFWLEAMGLEIVLVQPENINEFACHFFEKQIARRNTDIINVPIKSYYLDICSRRVQKHKRSSEGEFIELKHSGQSFSLEREHRRDSIKANIPLDDDDDDELHYHRSVELAKHRQSMEHEGSDIAEDLYARAEVYIPHAEDMMGDSVESGSRETTGTKDHEGRSMKGDGEYGAEDDDVCRHPSSLDAHAADHAGEHHEEHGGVEHEEHGGVQHDEHAGSGYGYEQYGGYQDEDHSVKDEYGHHEHEEVPEHEHHEHEEPDHGGYEHYEVQSYKEYGGEDDEYGDYHHGGGMEHEEHKGYGDHHEHREGEDHAYPGHEDEEAADDEYAVSVVQVAEEGSVKYGEETGDDWEQSTQITDVKPESSNVDFEPTAATENVHYYDESGDQERPKTPHETAEEGAQTSEIRAHEISCGMSNDPLSASAEDEDTSVATAADELRSEPEMESPGGDAAHMKKETHSLTKTHASEKKHSHKSKYGQSSFSDNPAPGVNVSGTISVATAKQMKEVNDGAVSVEIAAETEDEDNDIIDVEINLHCHCTP